VSRRVDTRVTTRPASRAMRVAALLCCALPLAACSGHHDDTGGLSADEDRQLNDAAAQLDAAGNAASPSNESSAP
jgi:hypothetical protein